MEKNKQITGISINAKGKVKIDFDAYVAQEPEGDEEAGFEINEHSINSPRLAHKDLLDALKKLRKYALETCEMITDSKATTFYTVSEISIDGDMSLRQARVIMTVSKEVRWTGKQIKWKTPQITLYGESEYPNHEALAKQIEVVISEAWEYLDGKSQRGDQLPLFPTVELVTK